MIAPFLLVLGPALYIQKIFQYLQPGLAGLFRMELHSKHIVLFNGCRKTAAILRRGARFGCNRTTVGVCVVDVSTLLASDTTKELRAAVGLHRIPANVRRLYGRRKLRDYPLAEGKARHIRRLLAALKKPLQADADAEKGNSRADTLTNRRG